MKLGTDIMNKFLLILISSYRVCHSRFDSLHLKGHPNSFRSPSFTPKSHRPQRTVSPTRYDPDRVPLNELDLWSSQDLDRADSGVSPDVLPPHKRYCRNLAGRPKQKGR